MKVEDLGKLKKGVQLMDDINSRKAFVEYTENAMKETSQICGGTLYTEGENKIWVPLSKEITLKAMETAIAEHKVTIARLEKEFEEL